jgi:hypothetical protein
VRAHKLTDRAESAFRSLDPEERCAVALVIEAMKDEDAPLVGPDDFTLVRGPSVVGRRVSGTDLVVCYMPLGLLVVVVDILRR